MARQARSLRLCLVASFGVAAWLLGARSDGRCALLLRDADVGEFVVMGAAREMMGLRMAWQHIQQNSGHVVSDYDGDAGVVGRAGSESWLHKPSTQATVKNLEQELMAMKIGGLAGSEGRRAAMHERRMKKEREMAKRRPEDDMLHMANRVAYQSSNHLEEDLMSMKIGGVDSTEGRRWEMHQRRVAKEQGAK
eukprot:TRINITY_DN121842_c0_g1_i1.p1 TRINITY_DN121842_c0_g1~~TRINITY_DN121842_c0_g1_i1.p1  ORF type:complete len:193 (+),score=57.41 TRINITY_DN121842_c0_g1_i1:61-639(+)